MSIASTIRRVAAAGLLAATVVAAAPAAAQFRLIVVEPTTPLVLNSVMWLAEQMGYYDREGVDVQLVPVDAATAVQAFVAGQGEMANLSLTQVLTVAAQGVMDIRAVNVPDKFLPFTIVSNNSIQSMADLAGKTFGVAAIGSLDYTLSRLVMAANGINPDSVNYVAVGPPAQRGTALIAGQIDATTMSIGVFLGLSDKSNIHVLVPVDEYLSYAGVLNKANVVPATVLANRRAEVEAVVRAQVRLAREFAANPSTWVEAMVVARPDYARENLEILAEQFKNAWAVNGGMDLPTLVAGQAAVYASQDGAALPPLTLDRWVDFSVIDKVLADLGHAGDPARR